MYQQLTVINQKKYSVALEGSNIGFDYDKNKSDISMFEMFAGKKRVVSKCNTSLFQQQLNMVINNINMYPDSSYVFRAKNKTLKSSTEFGTDMEANLEKIYKKIENILSNYSLAGWNICVSQENIKEEVSNNFGLDLKSNTFSSSFSLELFTENKDKKNNYIFSKKMEHFDEKEIKFHIENYLLTKENSEKIISGKYDLLFSSECSSHIITDLMECLFGSEIYLHGFFEGKINEKILPDFVNIVERDKSINCFIPFDHSGEEVVEKYLVKKGVLNSYFINQQYSQELCLPSTANTFYFEEDWVNIFFESDVMKDFSLFSGLFINTIISSDLNSITGTFICSISGFFLEKGKLKSPFHNGSISINIKDFMNKMACGGETYKEEYVFCPQISLEEVWVSGS